MNIEQRRYLTLMGRGPAGRIPHWEAWSNPDAETYLTGVDYYEHPKLCRQRMAELYPELQLGIPDTDEPKPHPRLEAEGLSSDSERHTVRWGDGETATFEHGEKYFKCEEDVFSFDPLAHADMRGWPHVVENIDYSSEEIIYGHLRRGYPAEWEHAPRMSAADAGMYNTMFMWPMLVFGWELFLACCMDERFESVMAGEGDNRVLTRNDPDEIRAMVEGMVETSRLTGGYMMSIGNHIPWNVPGEAVKRYLELCDELALRGFIPPSLRTYTPLTEICPGFL